MHLKYLALVSGALVFAGFGCAPEAPPPGNGSPKVPHPATPGTNDLPVTTPPVTGQAVPWHTFTWLEAGFTVELPLSARTTKTTIDSALGEINLFLVEATVSGEATYRCVTLRFPDASPEMSLDARIESAVKESRGKLVGKEEYTLQGRVGREILIELPDGGFLKQRFFFVKPRLCQLQVEAQRGQLESDDAKRFFNSYRLLGVRE